MSILQMSVYGGVLILVTLAVRAVALHRVPKLTLVALWGLCALRLLLPVTLSAQFSVYAALDTAAEVAISAPERDTAAIEAVRGFMRPASNDEPVAAAAPADSVSPWTVIWGAGAALLALFFVGVYLRGRRRFRGAVPETDAALLAVVDGAGLRRRVTLRRAGVTSPLTYGVIRPVILLPKDGEGDVGGLAYVITHELVHIRRFDGLKKLLFTAALCMHWFNPLVWLLYIYANRDIELACDDGVLARLGRDSRSDYAMTLIGYAEVRGPAVFSAFGQHSIEERIRTVMNYKKKTLAGSIAGVAVLAVIALAFATGSNSEPSQAPAISDVPETGGAADDADRPGWDDTLVFSEEVIEAAGVPDGDMETINELLGDSDTASAAQLRQRFAEAENTADSTLLESVYKLIEAEYDLNLADDAGLSPAGQVMATLADEYYMDAMETPGQYSGGYTYVADSVGAMHDEEQGIYSEYYMDYFVMYTLDYTYADDTDITIYEVAKRMSDFGNALFTYVDPLLTDGMTEAEARSAFAGADVEGKMADLLADINYGPVEFALTDVEIEIQGWGPFDDGIEGTDDHMEQVDAVQAQIDGIPERTTAELIEQSPSADGAVGEMLLSELTARLLENAPATIGQIADSYLNEDQRWSLSFHIGAMLQVMDLSQETVQAVFDLDRELTATEQGIMDAMRQGYLNE